MEPAEKEEIRARTDIVEVVSGYTTLKQAGRRYKGVCPFHQEKTPSFSVDAERGLWRCFGACSTGGDVFSFLMKAEGLSFAEAAERLAEKAGITLSPRRGVDGEVAQRERDERDRLYAVNALALRFFRESFSRARMARDYAEKRGLAHETLEAFGIGFAPDDWEALADFLGRQNAASAQGRVLADAEKAGLVFPSRRGEGYTDKFRGRLIFPIFDVQERVAGFGGRLLVSAETAPKYLNSPETPVFSKSRILYALNRARKAIQDEGRVVVVEGYMDAVAAHQAGFPYVVATLGTSLTEEHVRLLQRYTKNVILSFDADEAGVRAALRAAALFEATEGFALRVLALPAGEDPDSLLSRGDAAGFRKAIDSALSVPEFRLRALEARCDTGTDEGKLQFLREALPIVGEVRSPLERDMLLRRLAPYHPAFASGGARAEESLRAELGGYPGPGQRQPGVAHDPVLAPPVRLRGEMVLPPGSRRPGGGPVAYRRPGDLGGGGARFQTFEPPLPAPRRSAADVAEQTLLRAFLSDEWASALRGRLEAADFSEEPAVRLVEALLPLVDGGITPTAALGELTDSGLADYAEQIVMAPEEPLSEQMVRDCLHLLQTRRRQKEMRQIVSEAAPSGEGNRAGDDELLRRWDQKARALKGPDTAEGLGGAGIE